MLGSVESIETGDYTRAGVRGVLNLKGTTPILPYVQKAGVIGQAIGTGDSNYGLSPSNSSGIYGEAYGFNNIAVSKANLYRTYTTGADMVAVGKMGKATGATASNYIAGIYGWTHYGTIYGFLGKRYAGYFEGDVYMSRDVGIGTTTPDEKFEIEWDTNVDVEIGRDTTNTDITFIALRNQSGTKCYCYPNSAEMG